MKKSTLLLVVVAMMTWVVLGFNACSTSSDPIIEDGDNDPQTDGDQTETDTPVSDGDETEEDNVNPNGCAEGQDGCCATDEDCFGGYKCYENVCVGVPQNDSTVYYEESHYDAEEGEKVGEYVQMYEDGGAPVAPDISCLGDYEDIENWEAAENLTDVKGTIKVFGVEAPCTLIEVEAFTQFDESGKARTSFPSDAKVAYAAVQSNPDENFECHLDLTGIPMNKWLVFKSFDANNTNFRDTYMFNVYIRSEDVTSGEAYPLEIQAISQTSWTLIPVTMGVTTGVRTGRGALSGSLKDCQGRIIKDATMGLSVIGTKFGYFNANVSDLLPNVSKQASNSDGTYTSVDQPSGKVKAVSLVKIGGQVKVLSSFELVMVPGSVSVYSVHGMDPMNINMFHTPED